MKASDQGGSGREQRSHQTTQRLSHCVSARRLRRGAAKRDRETKHELARARRSAAPHQSYATPVKGSLITMSQIYADGAEVLKALDEQGGGPKLASLGDYGIDHHRLLDQLRILERPVINRQELRVKSIEKIAMERHAVVFEQLVEERIKILQKVSLFNDLSDNELRRAAEQFEEDEADEGTFVFDLGVPRCCGGFTPSTRVVSERAGGGWSLFRF